MLSALAPALAGTHPWGKQELTFTASRDFPNAYTGANVWVDLTGPGFQKRVFGFWDGGRPFRVRVVAIEPGTWRWRSGSTPADPGLGGKTGSFAAVAWTEEEKRANPVPTAIREAQRVSRSSSRFTSPARRREIYVVLVWRLDRWGRSVTDLLATLQELEHLGVGFVSLTEALDLTTTAGRAMAGPRLMTFGYSDAVGIFVNGQKVFQGDATYVRRDIQFLGTVSMRGALWLLA